VSMGRRIFGSCRAMVGIFLRWALDDELAEKNGP